MILLNKQILLLIACTPIVSCLYAQKAKTSTAFSIEGKIDQFGNGFLVGTIVDPKSNTITLDTVFIRNDSFLHRARITAKQIIQYVAGNEKFSKYRKAYKDGDSVMVDFADKRLKTLEIVAYPGAIVKINGEASTYFNAYPSGDMDNEMLAKLNKLRYPLLDEESSLDYTDKQNIRKTLQKEEYLVDSIANIESTFVKNNPASLISSYLLLEKFKHLNSKSPAQADSVLNLLRTRNSDIYYKDMLRLQHNRLKEISLSVGDLFPEFQTRFIYKDSVFDLSQTKGKYRLIDFWGTWCIPCVREMPKLKQFYESHKDNLIVIGVASDTYQNWKAFLDKNNYDWRQLIDQEPIKLSNKIKVEIYPTKYLLDPDGKVIMIVKDADEDVWNKIEGIINKK